MDIWIKTDKENVDWNEVADILDESQLSHYDPATEEKIFRNSYAVAYICDGDKIVGCGRAIVDSLVEQVKGCTIILYTHPQTLAMYEKFGFRRQKTGFVMFAGDEEQQKWLEEEGQLPVEAGRYRLLWAPVCPWHTEVSS